MPQGDCQVAKQVLRGGDDSEGLHLSSIALLMLAISPARPPRASTTRGTKSIPEKRKAERLFVNFLCTPTWRAWPGVSAASVVVSSCSRWMTSTSKADGRPRLQQGRKMSPGRAWKPGTKPGSPWREPGLQTGKQRR